jgi:hypothetical protein
MIWMGGGWVDGGREGGRRWYVLIGRIFTEETDEIEWLLLWIGFGFKQTRWSVIEFADLGRVSYMNPHRYI